MLQNPLLLGKRKGRKKKLKKESRVDSLFSGSVVSRRSEKMKTIHSPPHRKFTQRVGNRPLNNFHNLRNRFNQRQEQVYDRYRVQELNKGLGRGGVENSNPTSYIHGSFILRDEEPKFYSFQPEMQMRPKISREVTSFSSRRLGTPPKFVKKKFMVSPQPSIFKKFKKIPVEDTEDFIRETRGPKFTPRIMEAFKFGNMNEENEENDEKKVRQYDVTDM